ncbi:DNZ54_00345 family protein [Pantoea stewartii]|uniref:DNZ54_00345 family protein n=1 Tax=Pantoea stewartii TaxID=66269 RepID=UPI00197E925F|nr:DNZ54_00345 family protein [Pantoea stewartii]
MKKKLASRVVMVIYLLVVLAGLLHPQGAAVNVVVAVTWLLNIITGLLSASSVLTLYAEGKARQEFKAVLRKFFVPDRPSLIGRIYGWVLKLLIVLMLAFSGWVITLVCYLLMMVIFSIMRRQLSEPERAEA